jgi:hypothetical protein
MWIPSHNERNLFRAAPAIQLRLASQSLMHIIIRFPIQRAGQVVCVSKSLKVMELVLKTPFVEIAAEADIQRARKTSSNVNTVITRLASHRSDYAAIEYGSVREMVIFDISYSHGGNEHRDASTPPEARFAPCDSAQHDNALNTGSHGVPSFTTISSCLILSSLPAESSARG